MSRAPYSLPKNPIGFGPLGQCHRLGYDAGLALSQSQAGGALSAGSHGRDRREYLREELRRRDRGRRNHARGAGPLRLQSQERAISAINEGYFQREIVPVTIPQRRGADIVVDTDEHPFYRRENGRYEVATSREKLGALRPAFREGGTVTAGNSSGMNDGAARSC